MVDENIPIPDPSDKTVIALRDAIAQLSLLVDAKMGGIQAVIAEQFKGIDKRLSERDTRFEVAGKDAKEAVSTALSAVIEASKSGTIRFEVLERRVSALELAITTATGKATGSSELASGIATAIGTVIAFTMAFFAYYTLTHKD